MFKAQHWMGRSLVVFFFATGGCNVDESNESEFVDANGQADVVLRVAGQRVPVIVTGGNRPLAAEEPMTGKLQVRGSDVDLLLSHAFTVETGRFPRSLITSPKDDLGFVVQTAEWSNGQFDWSKGSLFELNGKVIWSHVLVEVQGDSIAVGAVNTMVSSIADAPARYSDDAPFPSDRLANQPRHSQIFPASSNLRIIAIPRGPKFWGCLSAECVIPGERGNGTFQLSETGQGNLP